MYFTLCDTLVKLVLAQLSFGCLIKFPFDSGETPSFFAVDCIFLMRRRRWGGEETGAHLPLKPPKYSKVPSKVLLENVLPNPTCGGIVDKRVLFFPPREWFSYLAVPGWWNKACTVSCRTMSPHTSSTSQNRCKHLWLLWKIGPVSSTCPWLWRLILRIRPERTAWILLTESLRQPF